MSLVVHLAIVVFMIIIIQIICSQLQIRFGNTDALVYSQVVKLAYIAVIALGFSPVMRLVFSVADFICKKAGAFHFAISLKLTKSNWGRFLVMVYLIIFSGSFFCGLYTLFENTRVSADALSRESIHYQSYYIYDEAFASGKNAGDKDAFYTLKYQAKMENGEHIWVTGIDGQYLKEYETFQMAELLETGKCQ